MLISVAYTVGAILESTKEAIVVAPFDERHGQHQATLKRYDDCPQWRGNWVKWSGLFLQAICTLVAIAMVHSENGTTSAIAMTLFATGVAVSVMLIAAHNRPFSGEISVRPDTLLQILPQEGIKESAG